MVQFKKYICGALLIYWNMYYGRDKTVLLGVVVAAVCSLLLCLAQVVSLGFMTPIFLALLALLWLLAWFVALPCVIFLIDAQKNPARLNEMSKDLNQKLKA